MTDLPDDILLLICQHLYSNGIIGHRDKIRQISRVGEVNRQLRRIERMFWRKMVNEKNLTKNARPIKIPKHVKVSTFVLNPANNF